MDFYFSFNPFPPWPRIIACRLLLNSQNTCQLLKEVTLLCRHQLIYPVKWRKTYCEQGLRFQAEMNCSMDERDPNMVSERKWGIPLVNQPTWWQNAAEGPVSRQSSSLLISKCHSSIQFPYKVWWDFFFLPVGTSGLGWGMKFLWEWQLQNYKAALLGGCWAPLVAKGPAFCNSNVFFCKDHKLLLVNELWSCSWKVERECSICKNHGLSVEFS